MLKLEKFNLNDFSSSEIKNTLIISGGKERTTAEVPAGGATCDTSGGTYDYGAGSFDYKSDTETYSGDGTRVHTEFHQP